MSVASVALTLLASSAGAQAWSYPSFQPPRVTLREFNFAVAHAGGAGTSLVFQWREQTGARGQFSLDAGIADPDGNRDAQVLLGGTLAWQVATSTADAPLDFLLTAGANIAAGGITVIRLPVGVSLGHRFLLENDFALTPYLHPRLSLDLCNDCGGGNSDLGVSFDVGANFELTPTLALRGSAIFGGSDIFDDDGFGISLAWIPPGLRSRE